MYQLSRLRLRADAAATRFTDLTLGQLCDLPIGKALAHFRNLKLSKQQAQVAGELLREISSRLQFLNDVGLDYLESGASRTDAFGR